MGVAFGLLMGLCLELIGVGCKYVACWDVVRVIAYGSKGITGSVVVNVDEKIMILVMN